MFPDSSELAFIETLCTFTRNKSWHKGYKIAPGCLSWPMSVSLHLLRNKTRAFLCRGLAKSLLSIHNVSKYCMGPRAKQVAFLLISISVYGNQGSVVSDSQDAKWSLVLRIINKTLILKDSCKFGINYEWEDEKTPRESCFILFIFLAESYGPFCCLLCNVIQFLNKTKKYYDLIKCLDYIMI